MASEGILLGMGNPLIDIVSGFIKAVNLVRYDLELNKDKDLDLLAEEYKPLYDEMVSKYTVEYIAGGATQNSIRVAQWMLQTPEATSFMGSIGKDKFGEEMKKYAKDSGVNVHYYEDDTPPIGTRGVSLVGRERSLVPSSAANSYNTDHLTDHLKKPENWALVEKAKYFYIPGFFLKVSKKLSCLLVFTMNLSAPLICESFKDVQDKVVPYMDYVFGNKTEARVFSKVHGWETENVEEIALKISQLPKLSDARKRIAVITQGADPVVVAEDGKVKTFPVILLPKEKERPVDTNGAGDAFVGGFLSQLVKEKPTEDCVKAGCYAANVTIQMSGFTYPEKPDFE